MALAASVAEAVSRASDAVSQPEVLLPAYGCPDLLAAIRFAGATPVFVDLAPDSPWMQLENLWEKTSKQTVAIVGVDLFGIRERWGELAEIASATGAMLIQDAAQAFPSAADAAATELKGERIVLSFGRGKPVSLLHGGAVLAKPGAAGWPRPGASFAEDALSPGKLHALGALYNLLRLPALFWWISKVPALHVGKTVYEPLEAITAASTDIESYIDTAAVYYWESDTSAQQALQDALASSSSAILSLAAACKVSKDARLSRLALLCSSHELRNDLMGRFRRSGYFATAMYERPLPIWDGLGETEVDREYPNAARFASRLLTLPAHEGVSERDVRRILHVLRRAVDQWDSSATASGIKGRTLGV